MISIEQRFVGSSSLKEVCDRLAPQSQLVVVEDMTGYLARFGIVAAAVKIRHLRPSNSIRFVLEILERRGEQPSRYVILTLDRDFTGPEALVAYIRFRETDGGLHLPLQ